MDKLPLNFALLSDWRNWIIITLMVGIAMYGLLLVFPPGSPDAQ